MPREDLTDFPMPRQRLCYARLWIAIPIVFAGVPDENTSRLFQPTDQICPVLPTESSATLRMPGITTGEVPVQIAKIFFKFLEGCP